MEPVFNVHGNVLLSLLAFAGTVLQLTAMAGVTLYLALKGRTFAAKCVGMSAAGFAAAYGLALAGFSTAAHERTVALGGEKYFCEVDCHLAYSVAGMEPLAAPDADSGFQVVTLRVRFDPETVSPRRGDGPLHPNPRRVRLIDDRGSEHEPSAAGLRALQAAYGPQPGLGRALHPGESVEVPLVFELPTGARPERLLLTESAWETRLLIGHENSFFHPRTAFSLTATERSAAR